MAAALAWAVAAGALVRIASGNAVACAANGGSALKDHLFGDYDASMIPDTPLQVAVQPSMLHVKVDAATKTVDLVAWWRHFWQDDRLAWDPADWGNVTEFSGLPHEEDKVLWTPDTVIFEASPAGYTHYSDVTTSMAQVSYDGTVFLSRPLSVTAFCDMDLTRFPFDRQRCPITLGSWSYNGLGLELLPRSGGDDERWAALNSLKPVEEYDLVEVVVERFETYYSCCPGTPYYTMRYTLVLLRRSRFYIWCLIFPLCGTTLIGFLTFMVNPAAGERIGLGITAVLTIVAILWIVVDILPKNNVVTLIQKVYLASFSASLVTLLVSIVSVNLCLVTSESHEQCSRAHLLDLFTRADEDNDGVLDPHELRKALRSLGLAPAAEARFHRLAGGDAAVSFEKWNTVVDCVRSSNFFATTHSVLIGGMLRVFVDREHRRRVKRTVRRRSRLDERARSESEGADPAAAAGSAGDAGSSGDLFAAVDLLAGAAADVLRAPPPPHGRLPSLRPPPLRPQSNYKVYVDDDGAPHRRYLQQKSSIFLSDAGVVEKDDTSEKTEEIGRELAGIIDMACGIVLPAVYVAYLVFLAWDMGFPAPQHVGKPRLVVPGNESRPVRLYYYLGGRLDERALDGGGRPLDVGGGRGAPPARVVADDVEGEEEEGRRDAEDRRRAGGVGVAAAAVHDRRRQRVARHRGHGQDGLRDAERVPEAVRGHGRRHEADDRVRDDPVARALENLDRVEERVRERRAAAHHDEDRREGGPGQRGPENDPRRVRRPVREFARGRREDGVRERPRPQAGGGLGRRVAAAILEEERVEEVGRHVRDPQQAVREERRDHGPARERPEVEDGRAGAPLRGAQKHDRGDAHAAQAQRGGHGRRVEGQDVRADRDRDERRPEPVEAAERGAHGDARPARGARVAQRPGRYDEKHK